MQPWSAKPSSASPFDPPQGASPASTASARAGGLGFVRLASAVVALLAIALWLGGLLALGAIAAPVVFSVVAMPSSADAMTIVFRRFDLVAMGCALVVLAAEGTAFFAGPPSTRVDGWRVAACLVASALGAYEAVAVSPRIAALHRAGFVRGLGPEGIELSRLHDMAEWCGKVELVLLVAAIVLHVLSLSSVGGASRNSR
jgi:hypothetical protein